MNDFQLSDAVDKEKLFLVNLSEIEGRLDPLFYSFDVQKFSSGKFNIVHLCKVCKSFKSGFGAGKNEQSDKNTGVIHIRPTNIDNEGELKFDKNIYVPINNQAETIRTESVLFNNTNSQELVGKTALGTNAKGLYYSNHITKIEVNSEVIKPEYLHIILNIFQKNNIFYFICTNWNNQSGVGLELLKSLKIPVPPQDIQKQIVDIYKISQKSKHKKEAEAKSLLASIDDYLLNELGITLPEKDNSLQNRIFTTTFSKVSGGRFDCDYFSEYYAQIQNAVNQSKYSVDNLLKVISHIGGGKTPKSTDYSDEPTTYPIIKVGSYTKEYIDLQKTDFTSSSNTTYAKKGDVFILSAAHQAEYVGRHIKYLNETPDTLTAYVGELICVRANKSICNSMYLFSLLSLDIFKTLINREKTGQTSHIYSKDIKHINIPVPPLEKQNEIAEHIKQIRQQAKQLQNKAVAELEKAKQEIEQMILGE